MTIIAALRGKDQDDERGGSLVRGDDAFGCTISVYQESSDSEGVTFDIGRANTKVGLSPGIEYILNSGQDVRNSICDWCRYILRISGS